MSRRPPGSWREIADELYRALESFTAYDGYGQGGADDSNRGDWDRADRATLAYRRAVDDGWPG